VKPVEVLKIRSAEMAGLYRAKTLAASRFDVSTL
jgi:hypothetical protein